MNKFHIKIHSHKTNVFKILSFHRSRKLPRKPHSSHTPPQSKNGRSPRDAGGRERGAKSLGRVETRGRNEGTRAPSKHASAAFFNIAHYRVSSARAEKLARTHAPRVHFGGNGLALGPARSSSASIPRERATRGNVCSLFTNFGPRASRTHRCPRPKNARYGSILQKSKKTTLPPSESISFFVLWSVVFFSCFLRDLDLAESGFFFWRKVFPSCPAMPR